MISLTPYCLIFPANAALTLLLYFHHCCFLQLAAPQAGCGAGSGEQRSISDIVTRDNDLKLDKKAFTTHPDRMVKMEKDGEDRQVDIHAPIITSWQYFGTGTAPSFSLCHDLAEIREV